MKRPLLGLSLLFAAGILLGWWLRPNFWVCAILAALTLGLYFLARNQSFSAWILLGAVVVSGAMAYSFAVSYPSPRHIKNILPAGRSQNIEVRGIIVTDPRYRSFEMEKLPPQRVAGHATGAVEEQAENERRRADFLLRLQAVKLLGEWQSAEGWLLGYADYSGPAAPFEYGQQVRCAGIVESPEPPRNPGQFDFRAYLANRGTFFVLKVRNGDCVVEARDRGSCLVALAFRLRNRLNETLRAGLFAGDKPTTREAQVAGLLSAMLLGYREEVSDDVRLSFTRTGAMHIFAISGLHVGIVAAVLVFGLRALRVPRRWCSAVVIPLLFFYVVATGFRASAVRAFVMAAFFFGSWLLVRPADVLNCLGSAALVILAVEPLQLFDPGFQMSFAVVASIVLWMPRFERVLIAPLQPDPFLPRELIPRWRQWLQRLSAIAVMWFSLSASAALGALPFMAYYFNIFSPISVLGNMAAVVLAFCIVATGALAVLASLLSQWLVVTFNNANYAFAFLMIELNNFLAGVPWGHRYVPTPPAPFIALYYAVMVAVVSGWAFYQGWRRSVSVATAAAIAVAVAVAWFAQQRVTRLTVLDVGAGSAIFVDPPGERHDVLIDAGREEGGRFVVEPFLRSRGVDALRLVVLSQCDIAHAGGVDWILRRFRVGEIAESGWAPPGSKMRQRFVALAGEKRIPLRTLSVGKRLNLGRAVELHFLHPPARTPFRSTDDNSVVIQIRAGPHRVLLMSDAGETVENHLLTSKADLRSDIVCFGRHRCESMGTAAFLDRVNPTVAIVSHGGPAPPSDFLHRIAQRNIRLHDVTRDGAVIVRLTPTGWQIKTVLSPP